ncbi:unnamed protein product [Paramecium primaurelia]|uniref:Serine carboxypeptidase n=1 Tax=Paramecium primaurelia TaxID=5886 RepID=A0A8S1JS37_PARPR|nr:unnamed protein product [Paramecium primaurelia]
MGKFCIFLALLIAISQQSFTFIDQTNFYKQLEPLTDFYSETGYVGVNDLKNGNNQFFYHLFLKEGISKLADVKKDDNFILWLNGGPGCASLMHIFQNVGPYHAYKKGDKDYSVKKGLNTWNKVAHVIFIDQPFEVGLSYSNPHQNVGSSDLAGLYLVEFFRIFFQQRPQFKQTKFYVFGVSFGGHYVPAVGAALAKSNLEMNFQGIAIGNGWTDAFLQYQSYAPMLYSLGIFSEQKKILTENQMAKAQADVLNEQYLKSTFDGFAGIFYILTKFTGQISPYDYQDYLNQGYGEDLYTEFINQYRKQFGAPNDLIYQPCNAEVEKNFEVDISISQKPNIEYLLNQGFKVMIYQGSRDIICNTPSINYVINQLDWKDIYQWKKQPKQSFKAKREDFDIEETAGTIKKYKNFYYATIYNAGHMAPNNLPIASLKIVTHFLNDDDVWN